MLPDRVSNPGPLTCESGALPIALRGPAKFTVLTLYLWASEAQRTPGLLNLNPTGVGINQGANGAPLRAEFNYYCKKF